MKKIKILLMSAMLAFTLVAVLGFGLKVSAVVKPGAYSCNPRSFYPTAALAPDTEKANRLNPENATTADGVFTLSSGANSFCTLGTYKAIRDNTSGKPNSDFEHEIVLSGDRTITVNLQEGQTANVDLYYYDGGSKKVTIGAGTAYEATNYTIVKLSGNLTYENNKIVTAGSNVVFLQLDAVITELPKYDVTYDLNYEGSTNEVVSLSEGDLIAKPETDPVREGFIFDGWYKEQGCTTPFVFDTPISGATSVYAKWIDASTVTSYTVDFVLDGETVKTVQVVENDVITSWAEASDNVYRTFDGWFDAQGKQYTETTPITGNVVLTAKFTEKDIITYNFPELPNIENTTQKNDYIYDDHFKVIEYNKMASDNLVQATGFEIKLDASATITISLRQTGNNKHRYLQINDADGRTVTDYLVPQDSLADITVSLGAGTYTFIPYGDGNNTVNKYGPEGMMNWKSVTVDYTNTTAVTKSFIVYNQAGTNANTNAVRFVGVLENVGIEDITSIQMTLTRTLTAGLAEPTTAVATKNITSLYTALLDNGTYVFNKEEGKLYFYFAISGLTNEKYAGSTIECETIITLASGDKVVNKTTFVYDEKFSK